LSQEQLAKELHMVLYHIDAKRTRLVVIACLAMVWLQNSKIVAFFYLSLDSKGAVLETLYHLLLTNRFRLNPKQTLEFARFMRAFEAVLNLYPMLESK
jgi:hypothetical protein